MKYFPNPMLFSSVFVLPSAIADEHLKLASAAALKVILILFRCQNDAFDVQKIAAKTGLTVCEVTDACAYWAEKGVLLCDGTPVVVPEEKVEVIPAKEAPASPPRSSVPADQPLEVPYQPIDSLPYDHVSNTIYLVPQPGSPDDPDAPIRPVQRDQYVEMFTGKELECLPPDPKEVVKKTHRDPISMEEFSEMFNIPDVNQPFVSAPMASAAIATAVNMTEAAMEVAMDATTKAIIATEMAEKEKKEAKKQAREKLTVSPSRPTHAQICKRLDECAEVRELFNEAQAVLGRMLGTGDQAALLLLYDYYGLPIDVLLMLCEYARTMGKAGNLHYIYAVGQDWSEREIDTFERADEELRRLAQVDTNWTQFCALTGIQHRKPTKGQQKYMHTWTADWKFTVPMLAIAFEKMKENTDGVRFSYMNGILKNWLTKGITTPEQVEKEEQEFKEKAQEKQSRPVRKTIQKNNEIPAGVCAAVAKSGTAGTPASYDLDKAEQSARNTVPTLKKRKKN